MNVNGLLLLLYGCPSNCQLCDWWLMRCNKSIESNYDWRCTYLIYHKLSFGSFPESFFCVMDVVAATAGAAMPFVCIKLDDDFNTSIFNTKRINYFWYLVFFSVFFHFSHTKQANWCWLAQFFLLLFSSFSRRWSGKVYFSSNTIDTLNTSYRWREKKTL